MFVVVIVWFCCSYWLAFLILAYHSNLMHQFLLHWVSCFGGYLIVHTQFFWKLLGFFGFPKYNFWVFLSVPHLVANYAKIVDERGRNLMCHRTLPSLLVSKTFTNGRFFTEVARFRPYCKQGRTRQHKTFKSIWRSNVILKTLFSKLSLLTNNNKNESFIFPNTNRVICSGYRSMHIENKT